MISHHKNRERHIPILSRVRAEGQVGLLLGETPRRLGFLLGETPFSVFTFVTFQATVASTSIKMFEDVLIIKAMQNFLKEVAHLSLFLHKSSILVLSHYTVIIPPVFLFFILSSKLKTMG